MLLLLGFCASGFAEEEARKQSDSVVIQAVGNQAIGFGRAEGGRTLALKDITSLEFSESRYRLLVFQKPETPLPAGPVTIVLEIPIIKHAMRGKPEEMEVEVELQASCPPAPLPLPPQVLPKNIDEAFGIPCATLTLTSATVKPPGPMRLEWGERSGQSFAKQIENGIIVRLRMVAGGVRPPYQRIESIRAMDDIRNTSAGGVRLVIRPQ